jgi:gamma-glutamylcyclotransferase (GGCT)/AIG2-like uncharacterized protein YtfP
MNALVFAYGSNLCFTQMLTRCPSARFVERAHLTGFSLIFASFSIKWTGGVAGLAIAKDARTPGVIYSISSNDLVKLDRIEGTPYFYERVDLHVRTSREMRRVYTYALIKGRDFILPPSKDYLATIKRGYSMWKLPVTPLNRAVKHAVTVARKHSPTEHWQNFVDDVEEGRFATSTGRKIQRLAR